MKKLKNRAGMTVTELLVTVLLVVLLSGAILAGTNTALKTYRQSVSLSRAQTTLSTLMEAVGDELRLAGKVQVVDGTVSFASARKNGQEVRLSLSDKGELLVGDTLLVTDGVYANGTLQVTQFHLDYKDGVFQASITIAGEDGVQVSAQCAFRRLNDV